MLFNIFDKIQIHFSIIYRANNINNNYYNYFRLMNSGTNLFNFDKSNFISKDSELINHNPFKH